MGGLEYSADAHRELFTALLGAAFAETQAGPTQVIVLVTDQTTMRAYRTIRPQYAFKVRESRFLVMEIWFGEN
jgi:hypothetical protein